MKAKMKLFRGLVIPAINLSAAAYLVIYGHPPLGVTPLLYRADQWLRFTLAVLLTLEACWIVYKTWRVMAETPKED